LFDDSFGHDPLQFTIGMSEVLAALEHAVIGMQLGELKSIIIPAEESFGKYNKDLVYVASRDQLPQNISPQVGMQLQIQEPNGETRIHTVIDKSDLSVTLDANHPLAGQDLYFDIQLIDILPSNSENKYKRFIETIQIREPLHETVKSFQKTSKHSILIIVPSFNRKKTTQLSLAQTRRYKTNYCHLQVYNDHSTEYDNSFLTTLADEVIQLPTKMGIHDLRQHHLRKFLETKFDFLYLTDNDVLHDPMYVTILELLYEIGNCRLPVCLYNTQYHNQANNILYNNQGIMLKKTAPGVSMFFDRSMVDKIVSVMDKSGNAHDLISWDYRVIAYLDLPWITSETSYLEHFGADGIHNADFERDRAINPSQYLRERRESVIQYLTKNSNQEIDF
jgi:peptidylprolyl isomerase